jgi:hypothetical protein
MRLACYGVRKCNKFFYWSHHHSVAIKIALSYSLADSFGEGNENSSSAGRAAMISLTARDSA